MILLDSSFIIAYSNEVDENHNKAFQIAKDIDLGIYGAPVITDYIFDEVVTVMLIKVKNLMKVIELGEALLNATILLEVDKDSFNLAWDVFKAQLKPSLSFTDCTSIALCRINGISNIATFDKKFYELGEFKVVGF
ncbi:type II toxin-antitoxin system VapC family toxin [Candidatus Bathyarchaeota archaeon]|nr:type II toxin-antitoxin system VapC family toxin [Candidatus Bathyarchaeota archaeon]